MVTIHIGKGKDDLWRRYICSINEAPTYIYYVYWYVALWKCQISPPPSKYFIITEKKRFWNKPLPAHPTHPLPSSSPPPFVFLPDSTKMNAN